MDVIYPLLNIREVIDKTCPYPLWPKSYSWLVAPTAWRIYCFAMAKKNISLVDGTKELSKHTIKHKRNEYQGYSSTPPHAEFHSNVYVLSMHCGTSKL